MKIAVTGGTGFIGGRLVQRLLKMGYEVRILSRRAKKSADPKVEVVAVNYMDVKSLTVALNGCSTVFHLAAAIFAYNYKGFEKANIITTRNLVAACNNTEVEKVILLSSLAAAGFAKDASVPLKETDTPNPVSDYGITKLGAEKELLNLKPEIKNKSVVLRPPIVYGKNDSGVSKIASWVKRGLMVNTSNTNASFSFIYVDDLIVALTTALTNLLAEGQTYFVCEEKTYTWTYFIEAMARSMGRKKPFMINAPKWLMKFAAFMYETLARIFGFEPALNYDKIKEADIPGHWICTSAKWTELTGQRFTPLEKGLEQSFK